MNFMMSNDHVKKEFAVLVPSLGKTMVHIIENTDIFLEKRSRMKLKLYLPVPCSWFFVKDRVFM